MRTWPSALAIALAVLLAGNPCLAQDDSADEQSADSGFSVWQRGWYEDRGIDLPLPFGIALNFISMERDIEVTDVTVTVGSRPPESPHHLRPKHQESGSIRRSALRNQSISISINPCSISTSNSSTSPVTSKS